LSPDDKVRLAAVKVFGSLSYALLLSRIGKERIQSLGERCKDRKNTIRIEAMQALARMWSLAYADMLRLVRIELMIVNLDKSLPQRLSLGSRLHYYQLFIPTIVIQVQRYIKFFSRS
jgi:hypothetical protein